MELFSEIYGRYYSAVAKVLRAAAHRPGLTRAELEELVERHAFSESVLHLLPRLLSGEWQLLREQDGRYSSRLVHADTSLPLTHLQKAWIRSLLWDRRIRLFLEDTELAELRDAYRDTEPLFLQEDFHLFDVAADGDDYEDEAYIARFRTALRALREGTPLQVRYLPPSGTVLELLVQPRRMVYSAKDDKFRLACTRRRARGGRGFLLNIARIQSLALCSPDLPAPAWEWEPDEKRCAVTIAISGERNALDRCMLQFAAYDKRTEWDAASGRHICEILYDPMEETELLIRLLSFGPVIEVLGPEGFVRQVRRRIRQQLERMQ